MSNREALAPLIEKVSKMKAMKQVYFINKVFGNQFGNNSVEKVIAQTMNMYDEAEEFKEDGLAQNNQKEVIDAIGDLLTFGYGIAYLRGIELIPYSIDPELKDMTNEELIEIVIDFTNRFIQELNHKRDVNKAYIRLMSVVRYLCDVNDVDEDELMTRITVSNLSKICMTFEECQKTINQYLEKGIEVYAKYFEVEGIWIHVVYSAKEQTDSKGKVYRSNKFLKCVYFEEPQLDDLV